MKVKVKLFAAAKELAGAGELIVELPPEARLRDLRSVLARDKPSLERILSHSLWAVGTDYVDDQAPLTDGTNVALIPPVSGG